MQNILSNINRQSTPKNIKMALAKKHIYNPGKAMLAPSSSASTISRASKKSRRLSQASSRKSICIKGADGKIRKVYTRERFNEDIGSVKSTKPRTSLTSPKASEAGMNTLDPSLDQHQQIENLKKRYMEAMNMDPLKKKSRQNTSS